jgi:signal transduction histidine kinase
VLRSTLEEAERLAVISDGLMLLGRLESGELVPQLAWMDVRSELRDAAERASPRSAQHRLEVIVPSDPAEVLADPILLGMVLDQLIDNAIRYTPPGTLVRLSARTNGGAVRVAVEDEGPGVPAEMLPRLFEPFYRADPSRGRAGGPGLGLTVARAILQLHGGTIAASAGRAGGLTVEMDLVGRAH